MQINRTGVTRTVFIFSTFVIKVPNLRYGFRNFLRALLANIDEGNTWKANSYQPHIRDKFLCPVLLYTKTGLFLVMARADVNSHITAMESLLETGAWTDPRNFYASYYHQFIDAGFGGDDKPDNYGYYKGNLVKTDYAI